MKFQGEYFFTALIALMGIFQATDGMKKMHGPMQMQCKGEDMMMKEDVHALFHECGKQLHMRMSGPPKFTLGRRACHIVCVAQGLGMLDDKGMPIKIKNEVTEKIFPASTAPKITSAYGKCIDQYGSKIPQMSEEDCSGHKDFLNCVVKAVYDVCEIPYF